MSFEFDAKKSVTNKQKHGLDFVEAQTLWADENRIIFPARKLDEERFVLVGQINKKYWSAIYTIRGMNIRIISVRRSRPEEVAQYEG